MLAQDGEQAEPQWQLAPWLVAVAEIVHRLESQRYHWPVGRVMLQKIVYFATAAGLPTGLEFKKSSFGPFAPDLEAAIGRMQNNGLIIERQCGQMFEVSAGRPWMTLAQTMGISLSNGATLSRALFDLAARFNNREAEIAATVHYAANDLRDRLGRTPTIVEVIEAVERWKSGRKPEVTRDDILRAIVNLGTRGWLTVEPDSVTEQAVDNMVVAGSLIS